MKAFLILATPPTATSAFMEQDPAIAAGTFTCAVHVFSAFYPGNIEG